MTAWRSLPGCEDADPLCRLAFNGPIIGTESLSRLKSVYPATSLEIRQLRKFALLI